MTIPVPRADGDERSLRTRTDAQRARVWSLRAVMRRDVDARSQPFRMREEAAKSIVDGVTGEQRRESAALDTQNE